jgi:hypothetical protein
VFRLEHSTPFCSSTVLLHSQNSVYVGVDNAFTLFFWEGRLKLTLILASKTRLTGNTAAATLAMEPLSCTASVFAVASLAVQLLQSVDNARAFIRNFKSASRELQRLSYLLERLRALLQDVRDVIKRQASLQHFPLPSNTIYSCLRSCKTSLLLVEDEVKGYDSGQLSNRTSCVKKLHLDVKFGFKARNIAHLETRLQQDINDLNTALGMNTVSIL